MARRVCPGCGKNYNIADINTPDGYVMKPLLPKKDHSKCDACNVPLVTRDDDKESVIRDRFEVYKKETEPILDFYRNLKGETKVIDLEPKKGVDDYPMIKKALQEHIIL